MGSFSGTRNWLQLLPLLTLYWRQLSVSHLALAQAPFLGESCAWSMAVVCSGSDLLNADRWIKDSVQVLGSWARNRYLDGSWVPSEFSEAETTNLFFKWEELSTITWESCHLIHKVPPQPSRNLVCQTVPSIYVPHIMKTLKFYPILNSNCIAM